MIDVPPTMPTPQVIAQKIASCGLNHDAFSVTWQDELQGFAVVIRRVANASVEQFACIHAAAAIGFVTFEDQSLEAAYTDYTAELFRPRMIADAKAAVTKLGMLDGFPLRSNYVDLSGYAKALERHCGLAVGSVLRVSGGALTFVTPRETTSTGFTKRYEKILAAVIYASAVGDLEKFGFVGNEAIADSKHP
jgi:hypothetical protein